MRVGVGRTDRQTKSGLTIMDLTWSTCRFARRSIPRSACYPVESRSAILLMTARKITDCRDVHQVQGDNLRPPLDSTWRGTINDHLGPT
jgi:hypothetical protein